MDKLMIGIGLVLIISTLLYYSWKAQTQEEIEE